MKKDLSQPFDTLETRAHLLIEESISGRFVLFASQEDAKEYGEMDAASTLDLELDGQHTVSRQLMKHLGSHGFTLSSFRELTRETNVSFSLIDDTPGREQDRIALHVRADITNRDIFEQGEARLVSLDEYADSLAGTLFGDRTIDLGIARLLSERDWLGTEH